MARSAHNIQGRVGRPWRAVSARVYQEETHCWLCGTWVDQTLPSTHAYARSADHLIQLCHGGDPLSRENLRLCHIRCNSARSNQLRALTPTQCACSGGYACALLHPQHRRGLVMLDPTTV